VTVGCKALPTLLKMASVMQNKKDAMWSQKDELPVRLHTFLKPMRLFFALFISIAYCVGNALP
jgi:hypothetical protein